MRQHLPYEAASPNEAASLHNAASPSKAAFAIYHMILYLQSPITFLLIYEAASQ